MSKQKGTGRLECVVISVWVTWGGIAHWECLFEQGGLLVTTFFQPAGSLLERFL
ncbi:hypothetical protein IVB33_03205 [Bradyrhizobium sp. 24]|nr:hypothetical protein [Bradyrhizobium sp. 24]